jgi:hypothetical protein
MEFMMSMPFVSAMMIAVTMDEISTFQPLIEAMMKSTRATMMPITPTHSIALSLLLLA